MITVDLASSHATDRTHDAGDGYIVAGLRPVPGRNNYRYRRRCSGARLDAVVRAGRRQRWVDRAERRDVVIVTTGFDVELGVRPQ